MNKCRGTRRSYFRQAAKEGLYAGLLVEKKLGASEGEMSCLPGEKKIQGVKVQMQKLSSIAVVRTVAL